jgi:hypothetical protein
MPNANTRLNAQRARLNANTTFKILRFAFRAFSYSIFNKENIKPYVIGLSYAAVTESLPIIENKIIR